jgi:arylsulfatase A-like enzyme
MKNWQKICGGLLVVAGALCVAAYVKRTDLALWAIKHRSKVEIAANRPIEWRQGPVDAVTPLADRPPNIVFILADDLGINDISTFGGGAVDGRIKTPNIDRLAADGAVFEQAYSGTATCAPSRAMLMTGRYPTRTGFEFTPTPDGMVRVVTMAARDMRPDMPRSPGNPAAADVKPLFADQGLPTSEVTIAELLKAQGYHTVHIGKWHLGESPGFRANDQGFDESLNMESGLYLPEDDPDVVNAKVEFDPIDKFFWSSMRFATSYNKQGLFEPGGYLTDYWTDESVKVIRANRNRPFFLYLAHWGVHTPLQATREDFEAVGDIKPHRARVHAAMIRALDRSVGRILAALEEEGLAENTIVVFSSDNGGPGYVGIPGVNAPYRGWKMTLYEGGIRVPFFVKWPGRVAPGDRIATPVSHIDLMPTLASASRTPLPKGVVIDGVDLMPLARGSGAISRRDDAIYWQSGDYQVVRAGDWKLQVNGLPGQALLYNLREDPTERTDLSRRRPDKVAELKALLVAHQKGRKPSLWPYETAGPVMVDKTFAKRFERGDPYVEWPN